jgi:AcrR family transcriptional regulator
VVVFAGQGDPARSMPLLWRVPDTTQRPGPKQGLTVDEIVDAGISVADASGTAALSMRAVGEKLGRTAMALYTYVPTKADLVDLMYDRVLGELPTSYSVADGWRAAVTTWSEDLWAFYQRHPWVMQVSQARPVLGPNEFAQLESIIAVLRATGLPAPAVRPIISALVNFVRGASRAMAEARDAAASTGMTDDSWWFARSAALEEIAPDLGSRYPSLVWLELEDAADPNDMTPYMENQIRTTFVAGLAVLLDGVDAAITRSAAAS